MSSHENETDGTNLGLDADLPFVALKNLREFAYLVDESSRILFANDEACRVLGYSREELLKRTVPDIHPEIRKISWHAYWGELRKKKTLVFECDKKTRDGRVFPAETVASYFEHEGRGYGLAIVRDISKRRRDEAELRAHLRYYESMGRIDQAIQGTNDLERMMGNVLETVLSIFDCDRVYLLQLSGAEPSSWRCAMEKTRRGYKDLPKSVLDMPIPPELAEHWRTANDSDGPVKFGASITMAVNPKIGKSWLFGLQQSSFPRVWTSLEERLFREIGRRLTDALTSLLSFRQLQESEDKFKSLAESAQDAIIKIGDDGCVRYWNNAAERIFGWSASEMMGKDVHAVLAPDRYRPDYLKGLDEFRKSGTGPVLGNVVERYARRKDNREFPVELSISRVNLRGSWSAICILRDITERKRLEEQLLQSQKMEAIGLLAGGIAHDFNNILTAIIGYGNILKMKMGPGNPLLSSVDPILASSERAAQLTKGLLAFGRKQLMKQGPVSLNMLIRGIADILRRLIGEDIDFSTHLDKSDLVVKADTGQIEQVLMNLAANARDAMPDGGALSIATHRTEVAGDFVQMHGFGKTGTYAVIEVSDTGTGMDEKTREKIFEPFFTTKGIGKGTGLGLAIAYGIVKQHDGYILVSSEPGKGTTFRLYLPVVREAAGRKAAGPTPLPHGRGETVLLVEDDDTVRFLMRTVLENYGYRVVTAVDGEDGIEKYNAHKRTIDLSILDVIMPKKSGKEVYLAIKADRPDAEVLFTSGYPADIIDRKGALEDKSRLLLKPVSPSELLRTLREIFDRKNQAGAGAADA